MALFKYLALAVLLLSLFLSYASKEQLVSEAVADVDPLSSDDGNVGIDGEADVEIEEVKSKPDTFLNVHVLDYTAKNFDQEIDHHEVTLVEFYAPWCQRCGTFEPIYSQAADFIYQFATAVTVARVDCSSHAALCTQHAISSYPTLKLYRNDGTVPVVYSDVISIDGELSSAQQIVSFVLKQLMPAFRVVNSEEQMKEFTTQTADRLAIVGFFDSASTAQSDLFAKSAQALRNQYEFALFELDESSSSSSSSSSPSDLLALASKYGVTSLPALVVFKPFDEPPTVYDMQSQTLEQDETNNKEDTAPAPFSCASLSEFLAVESFPLLTELTPENYQRYLDRGLPIVWTFVTPESIPEDESESASEENPAGEVTKPSISQEEAVAITKQTLETMTTVTAQFKGQLSFVWLDGVRWAQQAKNFGIDPERLPGILVDDRAANKRYLFTDKSKSGSSATTTATAMAPEPTALTAFFQAFLDEELTPHRKSQPVPNPSTNTGPVLTLVGETFDEVLGLANRDVMVMFAASWCEHSQAMQPKWNQMAKKLAKEAQAATGAADQDNSEPWWKRQPVIVAQIDPTENDVPVQVDSLPTIMFYPATADPTNPREPITYSGLRTSKALLEFVKAHRKTPAPSSDSTASPPSSARAPSSAPSTPTSSSSQPKHDDL